MSLIISSTCILICAVILSPLTILFNKTMYEMHVKWLSTPVRLTALIAASSTYISYIHILWLGHLWLAWNTGTSN